MGSSSGKALTPTRGTRGTRGTRSSRPEQRSATGRRARRVRGFGIATGVRAHIADARALSAAPPFAGCPAVELHTSPSITIHHHPRVSEPRRRPKAPSATTHRPIPPAANLTPPPPPPCLPHADTHILYIHRLHSRLISGCRVRIEHEAPPTSEFDCVVHI